MSREKARLRILNWVVQFSLYQLLPSGRAFHPGTDQAFRMLGDGFGGELKELPAVGSLVALQSAPASKWYLSWVNEVREAAGDRYHTVYTLESIEDGDVCDWSNVSVLVFSPKTVAEHPEWRWSDDYFEFHKRWVRQVSEHGLLRPVYGMFNDDGSAELRARVSLSDDPVMVRTVDNWKMVTDTDLEGLARSMYEENHARYRTERGDADVPHS